MESVQLAEPALFVSTVDDATLDDAAAKLAGGLPILGVLAGRDQDGNVRLLVANPQAVTVTVDLAGLLQSGAIQASNETSIPVTSLDKNAPDLVSTDEAKFGGLATTELEPFSVQVYQVPG